MIINEIKEKIQEVEVMFYEIANGARKYMRRLYSEFLIKETSEALDNLRNVGRAFCYLDIIDDDFLDGIIRKAEQHFDELQEAAAPEKL